MFCSTCGYHNTADANYCIKCGTYLVADAQTETIPIALPGVGRDPDSHVPVEPSGGEGAALVIRSGGGLEGSTYKMTDKTTIGRSPTSDIFLDDVTVSREHAVVYNDGTSVRLEDRSSLNGTFVNHERVEKAVIQSGDEIQIGKFKMTFLQD